MTVKAPLAGAAKVAAAAVLFGASTPLGKPLLETIPSTVLAGLLYLGAAVALAPIVLARRVRGERRSPLEACPAIGPPQAGPDCRTALRARKRASSVGFALRASLRRRGLVPVVGSIVSGGIVAPVLMFAGLARTDAASAALWLGIEPAATVLFAVILFREHLGLRGLAGCVLVLAAALLLGFTGPPGDLAASLLVAGAAAGWALDNNFCALVDQVTPTELGFWKGLVAGGVNLALGLWLVPASPAAPWALAMGLGALAYGAAVVLYVAGAQQVGAIRAQAVFASHPIVGVALAALALGETVGLREVVAAALVLGGAVLAVSDRHEHEHEHEPLEHEHEHTHDDGHHLHAHEGLPPATRHSHVHEHGPLRHAHPHWPDLHHRHRHR